MMSQQNNLFDVIVEVHNTQGQLLFLYYPKAGVIEVKRNKIFAQVTVASLLERGTRAMSGNGTRPLRVSLPEKVNFPAVDEK